jgi:phage virion morphogenesis protein
MAGTSFTMDLGPMLAAVGSAATQIADTQRLAVSIGEALVSGTRDRFERGEAPDGSKWPASKRGGQTLVDTGQLKDSIGYEASPALVVVGTSAEYAATHQFGAHIEAKNAKTLKFKVNGKWVSKKSVDIPARPFVGLSDEDIAEAKGCVLDHIARSFGR